MEKSKVKFVSVALEKHGKKKKENVWIALAGLLLKPGRKKTAVNLSRLQSLGKKFGEKTFVVPGKVLGTGTVTSALSVSALEFSGKARKKIAQAKGHAMGLKELIESNPKKSSLVIVK